MGAPSNARVLAWAVAAALTLNACGGGAGADETDGLPNRVGPSPTSDSSGTGLQPSQTQGPVAGATPG